MDYSKIINNIKEELADFPNDGKVASYIPELSKIDGSKFGVHLYCIDGSHHFLEIQRSDFQFKVFQKYLHLLLQ